MQHTLSLISTGIDVQQPEAVFNKDLRYPTQNLLRDDQHASRIPKM